MADRDAEKRRYVAKAEVFFLAHRQPRSEHPTATTRIATIRPVTGDHVQANPELTSLFSTELH